MRKGGGHGKGSGFERKIAKEIVKAFQKKFKWVKQSDCWRSVLSGGHEMSAGDLRLTPKFKEIFPYAVECKFYKKIDWWRFLIPRLYGRMGAGKEWKWAAQADEGARKENGLYPLLVMKCNHGPTIAGYRALERSVVVWRFDIFKDFLKHIVDDTEEEDT